MGKLIHIREREIRIAFERARKEYIRKQLTTNNGVKQ